MARSIKIHPTACIHPHAVLGDGVEIGPYSIVGERVKIGQNTKIGSSCLIEGNTQIGESCRIFSGAVIGSIPQDLKYKGEDTSLSIGDENVIREYVTINLGTGRGGKTMIGHRNLFMAYTHIAHDCIIADEVIVANVGTFAGHVNIENRVVIGGMVAIHQFVTVGKVAIIGGCSKVVQNVPPFSMVDGHPCRVYGINSIGLKRANVPVESIKNIKLAFKILFTMKLSMSNALKKIDETLPSDSFISYLTDFIKRSKRGVCRGT